MSEKKKTERAENPAQWTEADWQAHLEKVAEAMAPAPAIVRYLEERHPKGPFRTRLPLPVVGKRAVRPGETLRIEVFPQITCKPSHLVVSEETAAAFDLTAMLVGVMVQSGACGAIPLEPFSVAYLAKSETLLDFLEWNMDPLEPGMSLSLDVVRRPEFTTTSSRDPVFRGIVWARVQTPQGRL